MNVMPAKLRTDEQKVSALLDKLSVFQRILLVADGTVTELLEQYLNEAIKVEKLLDQLEPDLKHMPAAHQAYLAAVDAPLMRRKIFLQGQVSRQRWMFAESSIVVNGLPAGFRADLLASRQPIGKLWAQYRLETFKELLEVDCEPVGVLAEAFQVGVEAECVSRTYAVYSGAQLIMVITEKFPLDFFRGSL